MSARRRQGFTLIEMLAVVALTTLVLTVAINFFIDLSRASNDSADRTRAERRATALMDRIARDLEGTYLVKKPKDKDPLEHPWLFLAESHGGGAGSDRLKFMTRTPSQRSSEGHDSDVTVVAYGARESAQGGIEVVRWSSPALPEGLDRSFPLDTNKDALVLASGLASFGVRFLDEKGAVHDTWDSSQLTDSSALPVGAEIAVSMLPPTGATSGAAGAAGSGPPPLGPFVRRVLIPIRPVDLEALLKPDEAAAAAAAGEDQKKDAGDKDDSDTSEQASRDGRKQQESCMTVAQCLALNPGVVQQFPQIQGIISAIGGQCFRDVAANIPAGLNLVGCQ